MHIIELTGSYTAALIGEEITTGCPSEDGLTTTTTTTRKDPVPVLCRELIKLGVDPQETVRITRGGQPVWKRDRTVATWAGIDIKDYDQRGLRIEKHRPSPYS